jgi:gluconate kinase
MPSSLLDSQLAALEPPSPDEHAWVCDVSQPPDVIVARLVERSRSR